MDKYIEPQPIEIDVFAWDVAATYYRVIREQDERAEALRQEILAARKHGKAA